MSPILTRPGTAAHLNALTPVHAGNVQHGSGTFELDPGDALPAPAA